jgi:hypothetical protein
VQHAGWFVDVITLVQHVITHLQLAGNDIDRCPAQTLVRSSDVAFFRGSTRHRVPRLTHSTFIFDVGALLDPGLAGAHGYKQLAALSHPTGL